MNNRVVNDIFNNVIDIIIKDTDNEYKIELYESYKDYINEIYGDEEYNEKTISILSNLEVKKWQNQDKISKYQRLLKDDAMNELFELSEKMYNLAISKKMGNVNMEDTFKDKIDNIDNLFEKIRPFNKKRALFLKSEVILEYNYVFKNAQITSIRTGHIKI